MKVVGSSAAALGRRDNGGIGTCGGVGSAAVVERIEFSSSGAGASTESSRRLIWEM